MVDVKKLVTGFLILASVAGSLAFVFSGSGLNPRGAADTNQAEITAESQTQIPTNAFVKTDGQGGQISANSAASSPLKDLPPVANSSNLTENLAQNLTRELLQSNPSGPQDAAGEQNLIMPSDTKLTAAADKSIAGFAAQGSYAILNFDEKIKDEEIKILSNFGPNDVSKYLGTINGILEKTIASPEVNKLAEAEPSMESVSAMQLIYESAMNEVRSTPAPAPMAQAHKQILALLANREKFIGIAAGAEEDPLKTLVAVQATQNKIGEVLRRDSQDLENELEKIDFQKISSRESGAGSLATIRSIFGIEKAEAFIAVPTDCLGPSCMAFQKTSLVIQAKTSAVTWANLLRKIWEWLQVFLTEKLKQTLINLVQKNILGWLQHNGSPRFVTNWTQTLTSNFIRGGVAALQNNALPNTCGAFRPLISDILSPNYGNSARNMSSPGLSRTGGCSLERTVGDVQKFYSDSSNFSSGGGWLAYGTSLTASNNYYGSLFAAGVVADTAAKNAQEAAKNEAVANKGYTGTAVCDDGSDPNGISYICEVSFGVTRVMPEGSGQAQCEDGSAPISQPNNGSCADGSDPKIATPGSTVADISSQGTRAQIDRIVNANNLFGLLTGFASSYLSKLIDSGSKSIDSGIRGISPGDVGETPANTAPPTAAAASNASCDNLAEPQLSECLNNTAQGIPYTPPAQPQLTCNPSSQAVGAGESASFSATGGDGVNYAWSAQGGSPSSGTGSSFDTSYSSLGSQTVTVSSGGRSAGCYVSVE